ncbi:MAG: hypothetical protein QXW56_07040 [Nitrososphaerota archaeon]
MLGRGRSSDAELVMAYLRALATEELDDLTYLDLVASTSGRIGSLVRPLAQARNLFRNWGFGLGKALRSVASTVADVRVRGLVERMGKAVEAGMRSVAYVRMEYERMRDIGRREMENALEHARTLGDLYMTLISTFTFLIAAFVIASSTFSGISGSTVLMAVLAGICASSVFVVFLTWRYVGTDSIVSTGPFAPPWIRTVERLAPHAMVGSLAASLLSALLLGPTTGALLNAVIGGALASLGLSSWIRSRRIPALDADLPILFRALSEVISHFKDPVEAIGVVSEGQSKPVRRLLDRVRSLLRGGVELGAAMRSAFSATGSRLASDASEVLVEGIRLGVPSSGVGGVIYLYLNDKLSLRRKRSQVAGYLKGVAYPSVATSAAIMGVVGSLYSLLLDAVTMVRNFLPLSPDLPLGLMWRVMATSLVAISLTCALLVYLIEGSSRAHLLLHFGLMLLVSSALLYFTATGTTALLESMTSHLSRIRSMW